MTWTYIRRTRQKCSGRKARTKVNDLGSHLSFRKPGDARLLTICTENGKTVKTVYLDKVCDYLGLDD